MADMDDFLREVQKLFPNATMETIRHYVTYEHYLPIIPFTYTYGEITEKCHGGNDKRQIRRINKMFLELRGFKF